MVDYNIILLDDFDWGYVGISKQDVIKKINGTELKVLSENVYTMIIIDNCGKSIFTVKEILEKLEIHYDTMYYQIIPETKLVEFN